MSIAPTVETLLGASEPPPDAKLVRNGRYWIPPRVGEKAKGYTRVTTFAKTLEDTYNLSRWQQRMVLLGVAQRPDIQAGALADAEDKDRLNSLAEAAMDAAKANVARETGTALHRLCERLDSGEVLDLPDPWASDVAAYRVLLEDYGVEILPEYMEQVIVNNEVGVAGRFDRLVRQRGQILVGDLKTSQDLSYSWGSIAVQLALYAGAESIFDPKSGTHIPMPEVSQEVGLVFHLPSGQAKAAMYLVDLVKGREGIELIRQIRKWRTNARTLARTATEILAPLVTPEDPMPVPSSVPDATPVSPELRSYVEQSVRGIIEAGFGEMLVARWPQGVPFLKASKDHFEVEVDEILAVVHRIEAEKGLAFPDYADPRPNAQIEAAKAAKKAAKAASTNKRKALLD